MYTRSYDIYFKKGKSKNYLQGELEIDLLKYHEAFEVNEFHLQQQYNKKTVDEYCKDDKVNFIQKEVKNQLGGHMMKSDINKLIKELDRDLDDVKEGF